MSELFSAGCGIHGSHLPDSASESKINTNDEKKLPTPTETMSSKTNNGLSLITDSIKINHGSNGLQCNVVNSTLSVVECGIIDTVNSSSQMSSVSNASSAMKISDISSTNDNKSAYNNMHNNGVDEDIATVASSTNPSSNGGTKITSINILSISPATTAGYKCNGTTNGGIHTAVTNTAVTSTDTAASSTHATVSSTHTTITSTNTSISSTYTIVNSLPTAVTSLTALTNLPSAVTTLPTAVTRLDTCSSFDTTSLVFRSDQWCRECCALHARHILFLEHLKNLHKQAKKLAVKHEQ